MSVVYGGLKGEAVQVSRRRMVKIILCRLADADQSRYVVLKSTRLQNAEADWSLAIENQAP